MLTRTSLLTAVKRLGIVALCICWSVPAMAFALIGLNLTVSKHGVLVLWVLLFWLLAATAFAVLAIAWVLDKRTGRMIALVCCALGITALLALPVLWPNDFLGQLLFELLVTFPSVLLTLQLVGFHSTNPQHASVNRY